MMGEGRGWHKEACALAGKKVFVLNFGHGPVPVVRAFAPIGEGRNAACCRRRPLCLRGKVRLGRRVPVGEEPWGGDLQLRRQRRRGAPLRPVSRGRRAHAGRELVSLAGRKRA